MPHFLKVFVLTLASLVGVNTSIPGAAECSHPSLPARTQPDAAYTLELRPGPTILVTLTTIGEPDGSTILSLANQWGGTPGTRRESHNLTAHDSSAKPLTLREHAGDEACQWLVEHPASEPLTITYEIRPEPREPEAKHSGNDYRTRLSDSLFHMIGNIGLVFPEHFRASDRRAFRIDWKGFAEAGWVCASSYGPGPSPQDITLEGERFPHALFVAAPSASARLVRLPVRAGELGFFIAGTDWAFTDDQFTSMCQRIITAQREFFADHTDPWFLVSIIPGGFFDPSGGFSFGGTGLTNAFATFVPPAVSLEPNSDHARRIAALIAHEYFHTFNGGKLSVAQPEQLMYWFSEGFTDYFTRRMLLAAGLIDSAGFADMLNEKLGAFDANPKKHAPNSIVDEAFWSDQNAGMLPYQRGDLVALALDEEIRRLSNGARSLDDLIRDMVGLPAPLTDAKPAEVSMDAIMYVFAKETSPQFAAKLRAVIEDGAEPPLPESVTLALPMPRNATRDARTPPDADALKLSSGSTRTADPGFDVEATRSNKTITGVVEGSGAWDVGLRNDMKLRTFRMGPGKDGPPRATAEVLDTDGSVRSFEYDAVGPVKTVRRYAPAAHK